MTFSPVIRPDIYCRIIDKDVDRNAIRYEPAELVCFVLVTGVREIIEQGQQIASWAGQLVGRQLRRSVRALQVARYVRYAHSVHSGEKRCSWAATIAGGAECVDSENSA